MLGALQQEEETRVRTFPPGGGVPGGRGGLNEPFSFVSPFLGLSVRFVAATATGVVLWSVVPPRAGVPGS